MQGSLCLACSSTIPSTAKPASIFIHSCCSKPVCANCLASNPRLANFCPLCEDAQAAFRKGPRADVTRVGQVVFDAKRLWESEDGDAPPPYSGAQGESEGVGNSEENGEFVLGQVDEEEGEVEGRAERKRGKGPTLLARQGSKSSAGAEVDFSPPSTDSSSEQGTLITAHRRKVNPHSTDFASSEAPSSSRPGDGQTRQYYVGKTDTLQSIAIRFSVSTNELCLLNSFPRAVLSTSPHLLHTRTFILIPAHAVEKQLASSPDLLSSLEGPPQKSAKEKTTAARRTAEAKFRAVLAKGGTGIGETPADEKAARAYIGLAEDEFRFVDFGEGTGEDGLAVRYDIDLKEEGEKGGEKEMKEAQMDTARRLRFEAILKHALGKWEMDSDWEREQRSIGVDPSTISKPLPVSSSATSTPSAQGEKSSHSKGEGSVSSWFSRALNADRGEHPPSSSLSSQSKPRQVVALSSSVKLPTHLVQTLPNAHKGAINVIRYNTLGRYLLSGGSDRSIRLWNAKKLSPDSEAIQTYTEHAHEVLALDICRDNSRFVSGGGDKSVYVWDVASGSVVRRFGGHMGKINDVRFGGKDGDGSVIVAGGFDGVVRVFDLRAQGAWRPIMELKEAKDAVTWLVVRDDSIWSGSVDGVLRCYDLRGGQLRADTCPAPITSVTPSRLGTSVLVATLDSTVRLLDTKDGTLLQTYKGHKHESYRCKSDFTNEEDGVVFGDEEGNLVGWDTVSGERLAVGSKGEAAHTKPILWVEHNPDSSQEGSEIVTASADGVVKIWRTP
ncbi:hypothetical protein NDA11_002608 [Ustilago hordei]|uniref:LysM domain-containing protein n=1 Tax=Ustilago hordei TaxID=120017 RepID=I2G376_USTHO|nr:uncharacterized protein UHO2_02980 [Ustilago hordei]KAJ1038145.1 hypothetical protein NDA10_000761 [Ustilago hordei]KAJ1585537.1 hypothetical protein NDA15_007130 [Ustilago hordei]KAJ1588256.1 hypothetical protein NDA12_005454 [Ustilago hordei]KAJ1592866.1 hypothetical protein NDA11_002608 [Ustilago hordei]CCF53619.1 uncharacterized protein UHOR_02195 [Ustilago hordei]